MLLFDRFCLKLVYRSIIGERKNCNVFGDAALINYANLCEFSQNHIKCLMLQPIQFMFLMHIMYIILRPLQQKCMSSGQYSRSRSKVN